MIKYIFFFCVAIAIILHTSCGLPLGGPDKTAEERSNDARVEEVLRTITTEITRERLVELRLHGSTEDTMVDASKTLGILEFLGADNRPDLKGMMRPMATEMLSRLLQSSTYGEYYASKHNALNKALQYIGMTRAGARLEEIKNMAERGDTQAQRVMKALLALGEAQPEPIEPWKEFVKGEVNKMAKHMDEEAAMKQLVKNHLGEKRIEEDEKLAQQEGSDPILKQLYEVAERLEMHLEKLKLRLQTVGSQPSIESKTGNGTAST